MRAKTSPTLLFADLLLPKMVILPQKATMLMMKILSKDDNDDDNGKDVPKGPPVGEPPTEGDHD